MGFGISSDFGVDGGFCVDGFFGDGGGFGVACLNVSKIYLLLGFLLI